MSAELPFDPDVTVALEQPWDGPEPDPHGSCNDEVRRDMIKVWPGVARAAETTGTAREHRLWAIAQFLDFGGSGTVGVAELQKWLKKRKAKGASSLTVGRLLRFGDGTWWARKRNRRGEQILELRSPGRVIAKLGCGEVGWPVYIASIAARTLRNFRIAAVYASVHARSDPKGKKPTWGKPISRGALETVTGVERRTQRRWEKALGRRIHTQIQGDFIGDPESFRRDAPQYHLVNGQYLPGLPARFKKVKRAGGQYVLFEQMASKYRISRRHVRLAPPGRRHKQNKVARTCLNGAGIVLPKRERVPKLYYDGSESSEDTDNELTRRLNGLGPDEFVYRRGARVPGVGRWKTLRCDDGVDVGVWHKEGTST